MVVYLSYKLTDNFTQVKVRPYIFWFSVHLIGTIEYKPKFYVHFYERNFLCRYLARLALSDLLYLLFNIPFCFEDFSDVSRNYPVSKTSAIYYSHLAVPIVNTFLTMSIYIVVWLSYDRCIAVCSPHKFSARQRLEVVKIRCGISLALTLLVYIPSPLRQTFECGEEGCCVFDSSVLSSQWYITYELIREFYSRFIPALAITGFNVAIIITLHQVKKARRGREQPDVINEARQDRERRLVILLLAITVFFYVSTLPSALYKIISSHSLNFVPYFRAVADILEVSGHVFNFVLYFLFSPEFRKTLISLHRQDNNIAMTSSIVQG